MIELELLLSDGSLGLRCEKRVRARIAISTTVPPRPTTYAAVPDRPSPARRPCQSNSEWRATYTSRSDPRPVAKAVVEAFERRPALDLNKDLRSAQMPCLSRTFLALADGRP